MARILCFSEAELRRFTSAGILIRTSAKLHGRQRTVYDLELNVTRYINYLTTGASRSREEYQDEKRLTQSIVREQKQLELKIAKGDMVDRELVVEVMTRGITQAKNHLLGLPARLPRVLAGQRDPNKIRQILDTAIRNCLTEVSKIGAHSFEKLSKNGATSGDNDAIKRVKKRVNKRRKTSSS
jgi:hypothetical protein